MKKQITLYYLLFIFISINLYALSPVASLKINRKHLTKNLRQPLLLLSTISDYSRTNDYLSKILNDSENMESDFDIFINLYKLPENPFRIYSLIIINKAGIQADYPTIYGDDPMFDKKGDYYLFGTSQVSRVFSEEDLLSDIDEHKSKPFVLSLPVRTVYSYFYPLMAIYKGMLNLSFADNPVMQKNMSMLFEFVLGVLEGINDIVFTKDLNNYTAVVNFNNSSVFPALFTESSFDEEILYNSLKTTFLANSFSLNIKHLRNILNNYYKKFLRLRLLNNKSFQLINSKTDRLLFQGNLNAFTSETKIFQKDSNYSGGVSVRWKGLTLNKDLIGEWLNKTLIDTPFKITIFDHPEKVQLNLSLKDTENYSKLIPPTILYTITSLFSKQSEFIFDLFLKENSINCSLNGTDLPDPLVNTDIQYLYLTKEAFKAISHINGKDFSPVYDSFFKNDLFMFLKRNGNKLTFQLRAD